MDFPTLLAIIWLVFRVVLIVGFLCFAIYEIRRMGRRSIEPRKRLPEKKEQSDVEREAEGHHRGGEAGPQDD